VSYQGTPVRRRQISSLEQYRTKIRETDRQLLSLIHERLSLGDKVAEEKEEKGLPTIDTSAEHAVLDNLTETATTLGLSTGFARRLGELLIEESIRVQDEGKPKQSKDQMLKEIFELTQKMLAQGQHVTRFDLGEPNFPASTQIMHGLTDTFRKKKIIGYGPAAGLPELRRALAEELSAQHNLTIDPDQILITPGGRFAIFATVTSFVSALERVVIPQPLWPAYEECVNFVKGRVIPINTTLDDGWEIDLGLLETELKEGAKMLVLNSPCNPTGKLIGKKKFQEILDLVEKYDTLVISDKVYERYTHSKPPSILESECKNFVYINSFSKQFSLTGWRIAYLVTTKEKALRTRRAIQTAITCVPEFIQRAALVALKKGRREAQRHITDIMKKLDLTCRELSKINVSFYNPEGAFYVFPRVNKPNFDSLGFARHLLEKQHISVTPGQSFGPYPTFFRLAVSLPASQIPNAINAIGRAIDAWS
jgi:aspartate aminotransferase